MTSPALIYFHHVLDSTNRAALALADTAPAGTAVVSEVQTAGRGRRERSWQSPSGGLWLSVVLRPPGGPHPSLSLGVAAAAAHCIARVSGVQTALKWPNDIIYDGRKLAGVLLETAGNAVVAGVGVNVNVPGTAFTGPVAGTATSLLALTGRLTARPDLLSLLVPALVDASHRPHAANLAAWRDLAETLGRRVLVSGPTGAFTGTALDIDPSGALLVETAGGVRQVLAADVSIRPEGDAATAEKYGPR